MELIKISENKTTKEKPDIENILRNYYDYEYRLISDEKKYEEYMSYYFLSNPRRRKKPFPSPIHPSINEWQGMNRQQKNNLKQEWGKFAKWLVDEYGFRGLNIDECAIVYALYFKTKHRRDLGNFVFKFFEDGIVQTGMLTDDNMNVINPLVIKGAYDKENPRMEILIFTNQEGVFTENKKDNIFAKKK